MTRHLALFALAPLVLLAGCVTTSGQSKLQEKVGGKGMSASELRMRVRERVPRYIGLLEEIAERAGSETGTLSRRAALARFELNGSVQMQLALFRRDPLAAVADAWALVLQMKDLLHRRAQALLAPEELAFADQRFSEMERDLQGLWRQAVGRQDISRTEQTVRRWVAAHPADSLATRASTVELLASVTAESGTQSIGAAAGDLLETTRDLVDRMDVLTLLAPLEFRWQGEYLLARDLPQLTQVASSNAVEAGLDTLTAPKNLDRVQTVVQAAVEAALKSSLGRRASTPVPPADRGDVIPASFGAPAGPVLGATPTRPDALGVQLARESGEAAARALSQELIRQLGPDGKGPLGAAVSDTAARITAAAIQEARAELRGTLFPQCQGPDRARCVEAQLARLSGTVSAGATRGVKSELTILPVLLGFFAGVAAVLLLWLGWALRGSSEARLRHRARA